MNHIYKVIWNKAKHCYTVVSEIAKSHSQSNKRVRSMTAVVAAAMMLTGFGGMAIEAANPASGDTNITIGKGASCSIWNGVTGHDGFTSGYISIGENALAWDGEHTYKDKARIGTKEYLLDFNQGAVVGAESFFGFTYKYRVTDGTKLAGAIAIGKNTMARTGSVMIGDHTYKGQLGDIEVDPSNKMNLNNGVYSTTLGTSSYNSGSMATVTGALSIASGNKDTKDTQNFGATIYGSLNSIESSTTSNSASGMSNSVLGFGNRTQNANASLVWGNGNEVTNSIEKVTFSADWNKTSASDAQKEIINAMQSSQYAGGSVMAIGGGNKADWATYSQLLGVQNTLTGTEKDVSKLTLINGYKNTVTNAQNTTIIGSNNKAKNIKSTIVMGDHNTLEDRENVISLGNNNTVDANDAVAIGNGTTVRAESGVAIGVGSVADRVADSEKGKLGAFAPANIPTAEKSTWTSTKGAVSVGDTANNITRQITNVAAGNEDTDAVNVAQLKQVASQAERAKTTVSDGTNTTVTPTVAEDGHTDYKVNLNKDLTGIESMTNGSSSIRMGNGGTVTINNRVTIDQSGKISGVAAGEVKEGSTDAVNGSQLKGVENKADKNAENIQKNTDAIDKNTKAIDKNTADISKNAEAISKNTENIKKNSEAIAENAKNIQKNTKAIAKNTEDISKNTEAIGNLDKRVTKVEEVAKKHTTVSTDDTNVQISEDTNKDGGKDYKVSLNKDLNLSSVTTGDTKMDTNGVTVKDVSLTKDGLSIGNKTYVSDKGLNANDQKVTNVEAGKISADSKDAVNGSQLFETKQLVAQNAQSISKLGNRINKVGAGAAALAALHPLDFDPDDKWDFAAGYGNYNGENAAAIGAYYRPNEDTMFSVGGSFGNGENMVNAGVSLKLGQGNHVSTSKVAMAKEIKDLRKEMEGLKSALLDANAGKKLDTSKLQLFPDVPKNHWAYEYVSTLKGNGVLTGYPDGEFKGDRPMTRYEFATMLYKAMLEGATLSDRILKEFAPELERFTVDTVHQDKDGKPTVERVRTVKAKK